MGGDAGTGTGRDGYARPNPIAQGFRNLKAWLERVRARRAPLDRVDRPRRVGIPRAFTYYEHPKLWQTFFRALDIEPVLSSPTNRRTVERASSLSEAEHCLPNKLFDAHVDELVGKVDMVFVPRVLSTLRGHLECPKLSALPDAVRAETGDRMPVLTIDLDENHCPLPQALVNLGRSMGASNEEARGAADRALEAMRAARDRRNARRGANGDGSEGDGPRFLVLGHPYTLHEPYVAGPILSKLKAMGVGYDLVPYEDERIPDSFVRWGGCNRMYHHLSGLQAERCAGVIQVSCFNCGCDSMMVEIFRELLQDKGIPYMTLVVDEHAATAGFDTRLEAFVDSLEWRR